MKIRPAPENVPIVSNKKVLMVMNELSKPIYQNIVSDLSNYTGLTPEQVCYRIAKKNCAGYGGRGWYYDEFLWHDPKTSREVIWVYRCSQTYLFSNARKPPWFNAIDELKKLGAIEGQGPVLDFGGGIGSTVIELANCGFDTYFYEPSVMQTDFVRFRAVIRGLKIKILSSIHDGSFRPYEFHSKVKFGAIIARDVFEHIPNYHMVLRFVLHSLRQGGVLIEYSPFGHRHVHYPENVSMVKEMKTQKMTLMKSMKDTGRIWRRL